MLGYEIVKHVYYYFAYKDNCEDFSKLMIGFMSSNLLWIICGVCGFNSINSKNSLQINRFFIFLIFILLSRITVYVYYTI